MKALSGPSRSGFPCSIDGLWVLATEACRQILAADEFWELYASGIEKAHIHYLPPNMGAPAIYLVSMPHSLQSRLLSVSAARGPVFRRYLLEGKLDQDETWAQRVLACDLIFHNILLQHKTKFQGLAIGL